MSKDKLTDYDSSTASNNTDVGGISVAEGMLPSAVNNSLRELTKQLGAFADGTDGIDVLSLADDDASHAIKLQAPSAVTADTTFTLPDGDGASGQAMITDGAGALSWAAPYGNRNLIINGACVIDQRNAGASVTPNLLAYPVDRIFGFGSVTGKFSCQQNSGSVTPPVGFSNYIGAVSLSAYSVGSAEQYIFGQPIEGLNVTHLEWGTSSAATVTLSFYVRSSLTGTFGGALQNSAFDRSYPFSYTISTANTWERKTITIVGDTSGTWLKTNGVGIRVGFSLGAGSSVSGTAGAWASGNFVSATGATSVVGTNAATLYITGIQLEVGSATPFEHRSYGDELARCRRYFEKSYDVGTTPGTSDYNGTENWTVNSEGNGNAIIRPSFNVEKRAAPTIVAYQATGTSGSWNYERSGAAGTGTTTFDRKGTNGCRAYVPIGANFASAYIFGHWTADAEL